MIFTYFTIFSIFQLLQSLNSRPISVDTQKNTLIDEQNREVYFHGVNAVVKTFPYHPRTDQFDACSSLHIQDFENLQKWGFNVIRLGVMWPGVEPQKGQYNETYLQEIENIINTASKYGIYTLIDFHQDIFSEKFCGDGAPLWLIPQSEYKSFPLPFLKHIKYDNKTGLPEDCSNLLGWAAYYFSYDVADSFEKLYTNYEGRLDLLAQFWGKVAQKFKGNKYVLGYELINEPFVGNLYKNPLLLIPNFAEKVHLQRVYERLHQEIRKYDDEHIIFFEPTTFTNSLPVGFTDSPGGAQYKNRSAISYHYYSPPAIGLESNFKARQKDIKRLGIAGLVSEFFIIDDGNKGRTEKINTIKTCEKYKQSWIGWTYKPYYDNCTEEGAAGGFYHKNGTYIEERVKDLARTYVTVLSGSLVLSTFDENTGDFNLQYQACLSCGDSFIYFNQQFYYQQGINVQIQGKVGYKIDGNFVVLQNIQGIQEGDIINVQIKNINK